MLGGFIRILEASKLFQTKWDKEKVTSVSQGSNNLIKIVWYLLLCFLMYWEKPSKFFGVSRKMRNFRCRVSAYTWRAPYCWLSALALYKKCKGKKQSAVLVTLKSHRIKLALTGSRVFCLALTLERKLIASENEFKIENVANALR